MRVFYTDVVAIIDEGVGNSTLSLALDEIISEGMVKVQKTGEPRSVVFYDDEEDIEDITWLSKKASSIN